jgi:uroporphyrinogen decarboxylase
MPFGTPDQIRQEVKRLKEGCNKDGYILAPAHHIQADTSVENILAFYQEAHKIQLSIGILSRRQ